MAEAVVIVLILAVVNERLNILLAQFLGEQMDKRVKLFVSMATGILISFAYQGDLVGAIGLESTMPFVGQVITGILIGGGSNYVYDIFNAVRERTQPKVEETPEEVEHEVTIETEPTESE